jgi:hypothetical protein
MGCRTSKMSKGDDEQSVGAAHASAMGRANVQALFVTLSENFSLDNIEVALCAEVIKHRQLSALDTELQTLQMRIDALSEADAVDHLLQSVSHLDSSQGKVVLQEKKFQQVCEQLTQADVATLIAKCRAVNQGRLLRKKGTDSITIDPLGEPAPSAAPPPPAPRQQLTGTSVEQLYAR